MYLHFLHTKLYIYIYILYIYIYIIYNNNKALLPYSTPLLPLHDELECSLALTHIVPIYIYIYIYIYKKMKYGK